MSASKTTMLRRNTTESERMTERTEQAKCRRKQQTRSEISLAIWVRGLHVSDGKARELIRRRVGIDHDKLARVRCRRKRGDLFV